MALYLGTEKCTAYLSGGKKHIFAGRPDYLILHGRLVWADPNIYLQATGTQYLNTGVEVDTTFNMEIVASRIGNNGQLASVQDASNTIAIGVGGSSDIWVRFWTQSGVHITGISSLDKHTYVSSGSSVYVDGTLKYNGGTPTAIAYPLFLFARNNQGTAQLIGKAKVYSAKFAEGSTLLRHLVPVPQGLEIGTFTCPSNGMFDIVHQQFYANAGTGNFTYGKDS